MKEERVLMPGGGGGGELVGRGEDGEDGIRGGGGGGGNGEFDGRGDEGGVAMLAFFFRCWILFL